jgi:hypothetical protein
MITLEDKGSLAGKARKSLLVPQYSQAFSGATVSPKDGHIY